MRVNFGRASCVLYSLFTIASSSRAVASRFLTSSPPMYEKIPEGLTLSQVIVIHRHGDRAQISREIGPNYPEHDDITEIWKTKLPTEETMSILAVAANHEEGVPTSTLYTGWDAQNVPYAQLTEI